MPYLRAALRTMSSIELLFVTCAGAGAGDVKLLAIGFTSTSSMLSLSAFGIPAGADVTAVVFLTVLQLLY